ncbi:hypothetical protein SARC_15353, partial [Sphaeroforma arctica JP610]
TKIETELTNVRIQNKKNIESEAKRHTHAVVSDVRRQLAALTVPCPSHDLKEFRVNITVAAITHFDTALKVRRNICPNFGFGDTSLMCDWERVGVCVWRGLGCETGLGVAVVCGGCVLVMGSVGETFGLHCCCDYLDIAIPIDVAGVLV